MCLLEAVKTATMNIEKRAVYHEYKIQGQLTSTLFPPKRSPRSRPYGVPITLTNTTTAICIHIPSPSLPGILI